jgi:hypothetical protein
MQMSAIGKFRPLTVSNDVRYWHLADIGVYAADICFRG